MVLLRRHRLGHGPQLRCLRSPVGRRHHGHLRGSADLPGGRPLLGRLREAQREPLLHGAHRHPHARRSGHRFHRPSRAQVAAMDRLRGRAHRPHRLGVVLQERRQGPLPAVRHLVADGDRRPPHLPAARRQHTQAWFRQPPVLRREDQGPQRERKPSAAKTAPSASPSRGRA